VLTREYAGALAMAYQFILCKRRCRSLELDPPSNIDTLPLVAATAKERYSTWGGSVHSGDGSSPMIVPQKYGERVEHVAERGQCGFVVPGHCLILAFVADRVIMTGAA
jgi:hypothetical protein